MGTHEATILAEHGVREIGEHTYKVIGRPYKIRFVGRTEDGHGLLWECDCPAGQHGRHCKHVDQVGAASGAVADELGME